MDVLAFSLPVLTNKLSITGLGYASTSTPSARTTTLNLPVTLSPSPSVAVMVTEVVPTAKAVAFRLLPFFVK